MAAVGVAGCVVPPVAPASPPAAAPVAVRPPAAASGLPATPPPAARPVDATSGVAQPPVRSAVAVVPPAPGAAAPAAAAPPGSPPPFAVVIKDAKQIDGPITAWQKDDKVWLELAPGDFGKLLILSPKLATGIGEAFILGGLMAYPVSGVGGQQVVEFVRLHNQVRLQAVNLDVMAKAGTPEARATAVSYSPSLLGSTAVASQPHPQRKSVLIEANGLFLSDMLGVGMQLQRAFRQGYSLDVRNSSFTSVRGSALSLEIQTQNHYYAGSIVAPQPGTPPGVPAPTTPLYLPDTRSLFIGHHYSLAPLPAQPMAARRADARLGLMTQIGAGLQRRPVAIAARAHGRTLAPGKEGSGRGIVRTGQADHLLARPQCAAEVPRDGHAGHP